MSRNNISRAWKDESQRDGQRGDAGKSGWRDRALWESIETGPGRSDAPTPNAFFMASFARLSLGASSARCI
jgi:hypothetical protein